MNGRINSRRSSAAARSSCRLWVLLLGFGVAGCTSDTTPTVYIDLAYQVRCLDCLPRGPDDAPREVKAVDGEDNYRLTCTVRKTGGQRRVNFAVEHTNPDTDTQDYALRVELANIGAEDTSLQCGLNVLEGVQIYKSACSSEAPDVSGAACQASFRLEKGVIKGSMLCDNMALEATPDITRYLVKPGTTDMPAEISIYGCHGL